MCSMLHRSWFLPGLCNALAERFKLCCARPHCDVLAQSHTAFPIGGGCRNALCHCVCKRASSSSLGCRRSATAHCVPSSILRSYVLVVVAKGCKHQNQIETELEVGNVRETNGMVAAQR